MVKKKKKKICLPVQETHVLSLGWEDPPEKGKVTDSCILIRKISWTEEPGRLQSMELDMTEQLTLIYLMLRKLSTFSCANLTFGEVSS